MFTHFKNGLSIDHTSHAPNYIYILIKALRQ